MFFRLAGLCVSLAFLGILASAGLSSSALAGERQYARAQTLDLDALEDRLRETDAIGLASKLTLKVRLDSLIDDFRELHRGRGDDSLMSLKGRFNSLIDETLAQLRDDDPALYGTLIGSRAGLWATMTDPRKFRAAFDKKGSLLVATQRDQR